jgi:uncharacterized membrane protein
MLIPVFVLACVGVAMEVAFTALVEFSSSGNWRLMGKSYLWMFPIYALLYPAFRLIRPLLGEKPWWLRAPLYAAGILFVEYLTGWGLRLATGACPWDYGDARWAIQGVIRLDYAPLWAAAALGYELVFVAVTEKESAAPLGDGAR